MKDERFNNSACHEDYDFVTHEHIDAIQSTEAEHHHHEEEE